MKNIRNYDSDKYSSEKYIRVGEGIYKTLDVSRTSFILLQDKKIIKKVRKIKNWEKVSVFHYACEYLGNNYYVTCADYEAKRFDKIMMMAPPREIYVTSLMFEAEPEFGENRPDDNVVSQYPLEDIMDKFYCWCSDSYLKENENDKNNSYVEFASESFDNIEQLRMIIGRHVYNKEENESVKLIIE